ncbi:hypothetical protein HNR23_002314 [Nocardiopsis mwathae]|uniref:Uncharacterized protein n=1 Tax=Nocardiopsis mwathae TaxID=1472723 RepID=A0A7W9YHH6_9ACTN|nr:hypothetical protein [Nocardiopsis mwathae]MBB6172254.1 hypothetical protein [Nocardiopsis mwathae]
MSGEQLSLADAIAEVNPGLAETARAASPDWWSRASSAVAQLAREGKPFQAYDIVTRFGVEEPGNGAKQWGALLSAMRKAGVIEHSPTGGQPSRRPGAKGSMCREWVGTASSIREAA